MSPAQRFVRTLDEYEQSPPFAARLLIIVAFVALVVLIFD